MKAIRLFLTALIAGLALQSQAAKVKVKTDPIRLSPGKIAVFKEYFEKIGVDYVAKKEKVCEVSRTVPVYDLTTDPVLRGREPRFELCQVTVDGVAGTISVEAHILIANQDLFMSGMSEVYKSAYLTFGFGPMMGPYTISGTNSSFNKNIFVSDLTLKVVGEGPAHLQDKISVVMEVVD